MDTNATAARELARDLSRFLDFVEDEVEHNWAPAAKRLLAILDATDVKTVELEQKIVTLTTEFAAEGRRLEQLVVKVQDKAVKLEAEITAFRARHRWDEHVSGCSVPNCQTCTDLRQALESARRAAGWPSSSPPHAAQ